MSFQRGQVVEHKLGSRFVILRRVLLPWGGYLVRGSTGAGRLYRRRVRAYELREADA